jgi:hypothetical protein
MTPKYTLIEAIKYIETHSNQTVTSIGYEDGSGYKFYYTSTKHSKPQYCHIPNNVNAKITENKYEVI